MSRTPNYADVVAGTLGRVLNQETDGRGYSPLYDELLNEYTPVYFVQEDFTVATLVRVKTGKTEFVGVSKRNASDPKLPIRGKSLALSRAVRNLVLSRLNAKKENVSIGSAVEKFVTAVGTSLSLTTPKA